MHRQRTTAVTQRVAHVTACVALLLAAGCAYFNTFYNAKAEFNRAEDARLAAQNADAGYQKCIEKCQLLLRYYSKSKYVDDALFLMGMSRFHRAEYVQARASFEDLIDRFPDSEYVERARYFTGYAAVRQGDQAAAAQAFEKLAQDFPDSKLNVEAVFRLAEAQLDARDYDRARAELRAFMAAHPKSDLTADAQLRLAHTYQDEKRYNEAREEYQRLLEQDVSDEVRYDAQLNSALALRAVAEEILSDPALRQSAAADSAGDATAVRPLDKADKERLEVAQKQIDQVWDELQAIRKQAVKLGEAEHDIELAVTRALRGEADRAIDDLDRIARTSPKTPISARARYEIGEIHRRAYELDDARTAYDEAIREARDTPAVVAAQKKSAAIVARQKSTELLKKAPEVRRRWQELGGSIPDAVEAPLDAAMADSAGAVANGARSATADSLAPRLAVAAEFEALAAEQLHVAEIDLLDLDTPLVALREFERVLTDYPGSSTAPRAAFAVAWIYDRRLHDPARARDAYAAVAKDYADSPQGRAAAEALAHWDDTAREVQDPFSRP
jgi:TolA-binding protein